MSNFTPKIMTEEDRAKAALLKEEKKSYALANLKVEYADADHWRGLASSYDVRMPLWYIPASETKHIKRMAKKTSTDIDLFTQSTGFSTLKAFANANPTYTAFAMCGIYLEFLDSKDVYLDKAVESD